MKRNIIAASIFFGLAGFVGNWLKAELFFNVDFLFGSFFVMLAILRFGPLAGVVAGAIAAPCTYILWHHPWAIVIFLAEASFIAWRTRKKSRKILTQDILFWLVLGMPLVWLFYHHVMGIQPQPTLMIMLKQGINGIFNALLAGIANLLLQTFSRDRESLPTFRETIFTIMVSILMFPAIISVIVNLRSYIAGEMNHLASDTLQVARITNNSINVWIDKNHQSVIGLSKLIGDPDTTPGPIMQRLVTEVKEVSPQFKRMGVLDRNANTIANSPLVDDLGKSTIGVNFSDRPYISIIRAQKKPMIGEIVMGRLGTPKPMVPFLAPLISSGEYKGFCVGILDEEQIKNVLSSIVVKSGFHITLLDFNKRIIVSTRRDLKIMDPFLPPKGELEYQLTADVRHWVPAPMSGTSIMQRWRKSLLVSDIEIGSGIGWSVRVEASPLPLLNTLNDMTINGFLILFLLIISLVVISSLLSGRLISSLQRLQVATERLPQQLEIEDSDRDWPISRIAELDKLIYNFRQMSQALKGAFRDQLQINEYLEQRVSERTALLETVNEQLQEEIKERKQAEESVAALAIRNQTLLQNAGDGIHVLDEQGNVVEANDAFCNMLGYTREEILQLNVADWDMQWSREELIGKIRELITIKAVFETLHLRKDGQIRNVEVSGVGVLLQGRPYLYASARDLTERRQAEAALRESEEKYRFLFHNDLYAICIFDLETLRFLDVNDAYMKLYGYSRDELMGEMTIHDITVQHQESGRATQQAVSEGTIYIPIRFHKKKDGIVFPVEIVGGPYTYQGRKVIFALTRDISHRQKREEALREAHRRLDEIIESFPDATFVIDTKGQVTHWNRAIEKMTGILKADMLQKGEYEYALPFYGDRRPLLIDVALSVASDPDLETEEYDLIQREGDSFLGETFVPQVFGGKGAYLSATSSVLRDSLGNVTGAIESIRDVTGRKQIEEELRASEGLYRSMFENNRAVKLLIEPGTGLIVDANPAACNFYGYTRDQFQTMQITDINMFPREQILVEMELARTERRNYFIFCHRMATGEIRDVEVHSGPIEIKGRTLLYSIIHDMTDRRQAEKALQESKRAYDEMVARVPVGIYKFRITPEGHMAFDYVSPRFCEIMGLKCEDALRDSKTVFDLVHPEEIQHFAEANETARKKEESFLWEGRFVIKGQVRFMHIESLPKRLENGDIAWTGTLQDITDEKRAAAERAELEHRLQQAKKAESLGRMAGAIAHHFNNMLGVVIGNLELALGDLPHGSESHKCVAQAMKASGRAAEISRFMLTYLGQTIGKKEPLDIIKAAEEVRGFICLSIPANVHLKSEFPSQGPIIQADEVHIKQILTNLISNAVEAIGEAEGHITVAAKVVAAEDIRKSRFFPMDWKPKKRSYVCLSVGDTGPGLDVETIERIFDPFFTTRFTGRGLGLSVVLGLVRAYEGVISVASRPGRGAIFKVYFPMPEQEEPPLKENASTSFQVARGGLAFVVDHEPKGLNTVRTVFERQSGYKVITAGDGFEAVETFRAHKDEIRLVLLDFSMPGMNGWQTLAEIRTLQPGIPVILAGGYDEGQVMQEKHPERPQAFLHKPYRLSDLKKALAAAYREEVCVPS
ncbi:MAG: PAS domain S-box protein [Deltaproteobacteria bacterium]|nr:PAS domain S-box protein [Deltaproteobacteria bacterium]